MLKTILFIGAANAGQVVFFEAFACYFGFFKMFKRWKKRQPDLHGFLEHIIYKYPIIYKYLKLTNFYNRPFNILKRQKVRI